MSKRSVWRLKFEERAEGGGEGANSGTSVTFPGAHKEGGFKVGRAEVGGEDRPDGGADGTKGLLSREQLPSVGDVRKIWIDDTADRAESGGDGEHIGVADCSEDASEGSNMPLLSAMLLRPDMLSLLSTERLLPLLAFEAVLASECLEPRRFSLEGTIPGKLLGLGLGNDEYLFFKGIVTSQCTSSTTSIASPLLHRPLRIRSP